MTITFIYMMFILKIPILMLFGIVWWAMKSQPGEDTPDADGGEKAPSAPTRPRGRGPHGEPQPPAPPRVRKPAERAPARRISG